MTPDIPTSPSPFDPRDGTSATSAPSPKSIFFNSAVLGDPTTEYVCWLDVMGTANQMLRSLPIAANFIFKLHCAVLETLESLGRAEADAIRLYPIMDGVYITSDRRGALTALLRGVLTRLALTFLREAKPFHRFLPRGAIAFGPVYHGARLPRETTRTLPNHAPYRDSILLGVPVAQAYQSETDAPPFGIAIHSSARTFAPPRGTPFSFIWMELFREAESARLLSRADLLSELMKYFAWQRKHFHATGYKVDRIDFHESLCRQYFTASELD